MTLRQYKKQVLVEATERIVIEYANLSGRESTNRAEFRKRTEAILSQALDDQLALVRELIQGMRRVTSPEEHDRRRDHSTKSGYDIALDDLLHALSPSEDKTTQQ